MKIRLNSYQISTFELVFIIYLCTAYIIPSMSLEATTLMLVLLMYCFFVIVVDKRLLRIVFKLGILILLLALAYTFLTDAASIADYVSNRRIKRLFSKFLQYLSLYFPLILLMRVQKAATIKQKNIIMYYSLTIIVYVIVTTWLFLLENPHAAREWESFKENAESDVANYYFIYSIPPIISVLTACVMRLSPLKKVTSFVAILACFAFLLEAQYTLSILISAIAIIYQIYMMIRSQKKKVFFLMVCLITSFFLPMILKVAISNIKADIVAVRLNDIYNFLTGKGATAYNLNGRLELYGKTIEAFFKSPIWGNRVLDFDGHATFLTVLSDTGLIGGIPFYYLLRLIVKRAHYTVDKNYKHYRAVVLVFILMGLTNPVHASLPIGFTTWFLAPLMIMTIFKEKKDGITSL